MEWHRWIYAIPARLKAVLRTRRVDEDLDDELAFHVAMQAKANANAQEGLTEREAYRRALAGTRAIAVHSIGFTGKFLSEAIEEAKPGPIEALTAAGASPLAILLKGYWPQVKPAFLAIATFRWDINVRESAVLGLVGGGGLGMALDTALSNLYWDQAGLVLFVIFVIVIAVEIVTAWIRGKII